MMTDKHPLLQMISEGEHQAQDFKFEINDARKIAITISAFSNTDGGRLLIGVKDNGTIRGIRPEEEFHMIQSAAGRHCKPAVKLISRIWKLNAKQVLEVEVEKSEEPPVLALDETRKGWAYVRVKDQNIKAHPVMLELWKQQRSPREFWMQYKESSELLLRSLNEPRSLQQLSKETGIARRNLIMQLAYLVRWELAEFILDHETFLLQTTN